MAGLLISDVARRAGLRASALRYYEQIGLLPPAVRASGQRRYDLTVLHRLALVRRAREMGFTLREIRKLLAGFAGETPASERWRSLADEKLAELTLDLRRLRRRQRLLRSVRACPCATLDQCGRRMAEHACAR